ncbi:DNA cytosine methyltransferase [Rhizobium leguminosarum]|uniref:DNA cytosine methyltransferase n=1 Tax=Rhizobium leguminosarum TaxID=384 RepID=UPI0013F15214|nr:DNA cytosine methyltransferase [Rhizobium leguminosarum]
MTEEKPKTKKKSVNDAKALKIAMGRFAKGLGAAAEIVNRMHLGKDPTAVETLLAVKAGVTPDDTRFLNALGELLQLDSKLLDNGASPETLRLVSQASDEDLRAFAARAVKLGVAVDTAKIQRVESRRRMPEESHEDKAAQARWASLQSFAATHTTVLLHRLEARAESLLAAVEKFILRFAPGDPQEGFDMETHRPGYFQAHADIAASAVEVLADFDVIFGSRDSFTVSGLDDQEGVLLQNSRRALTRFASGKFGHKGGFAFDAAAEGVFSADLIQSLAYISTQQSPRTSSALSARRLRDLRVLELGAGAGGQAIGLMAAGFRHVALYEWIKPRADTLKANWDWPVRHVDLKKVPDSTLARYDGIDLLAGGIPSAMFTTRANPSHRGSENDLIPELLRAVRAVNPRAFMFEGYHGMTFEPHFDYLADFKSQLADFGYIVDIVDLQTSDYGHPLDEQRLVVVGIRNDEQGTFIPPILERPIRRFISDALEDLVIRYESPAELRGTFAATTAQHQYDAWARRWRDRFKDKLLPRIPREGTETRHDRLEEYNMEGFQGGELAAEATKVEDFPNDKDTYYLPILTQAVLSRARGFPDGWTFHGEGGGNVDMIADALSPILAKIVGLQIYSALTGVSFDLDAAISEPIIKEFWIGKKLRLNAGSEEHHILTQVEVMIRGEDAFSRISDPKARRAKLQELIEDVEPTAPRRTYLRKVVDRIRFERELQHAEDAAWQERRFPDGVPKGREDWLPET